MLVIVILLSLILVIDIMYKKASFKIDSLQVKERCTMELMAAYAPELSLNDVVQRMVMKPPHSSRLRLSLTLTLSRTLSPDLTSTLTLNPKP